MLCILKKSDIFANMIGYLPFGMYLINRHSI